MMTRTQFTPRTGKNEISFKHEQVSYHKTVLYEQTAAGALLNKGLIEMIILKYLMLIL